MPLTLSTFPGKSFDYATQFCGVWNADVAGNIGAVMLVVWCLVGIFIVMSA
jgi:hypothetical protein